MTSQRTRQRLVQRLIEQGIEDSRVLTLMESTPRHIFLDEALSHRAYEDTSLPIGFGQTLSQPYIVARMTELLLNRAPNTKSVLEIGTGSGYQTAILAGIFEQICSVERIKPLQDKARKRLAELGYRNVMLKHADGHLGWPQTKLFDAILSAAAPREVPKELLNQLAPEGVLVIPIGETTQKLMVVQNLGDGFKTEEVEPVKFVPLLGGTTR